MKNCILKITDPILGKLLGKSEFHTQEELRESFQELLNKHPSIPLLIRSTQTNKTYNKYGKVFTDGDIIKVEIPMPGQEMFNTFRFAIVGKGKDDVEPSRFGRVNTKYLELDSLDSFISFYLANYLYLDGTRGIEDRLKEISRTLVELDSRIEKNTFSFGINDVKFVNHLIEYFNLLKSEAPDFPDEQEVEIGGKKMTANISEVLSKMRKMAIEWEKKQAEKYQRPAKEQYVPFTPPVKEIEEPSGIFFESYDTDPQTGAIHDNPVTLGRRALINAIPNTDEYRIRLVQGNKNQAQPVDLTLEQIEKGVVAIIERWEGEWKPVFLKKDTVLSADTKAELTTDPNDAYHFTHKVDGVSISTPQLYLNLTGQDPTGKIKPLKEAFKKNPNGDWSFKIQTKNGKPNVHREARQQEKTLEELGHSLSQYGIINEKDTPTSGRLFLIAEDDPTSTDDRLFVNINRLGFTEEEIEEMLLLMEQTYSAAELRRVVEYLNNYAGLGQDIATLSEDPKSDWHISKLHSRRVVTFYANTATGKVEIVGERKKEGGKYEVIPTLKQTRQPLTSENRDFVKSVLEATLPNIIKGEGGEISLAWTKLEFKDGKLVSKNQTGKLREDFYRRHIVSAYRPSEGRVYRATSIVAYPHTFPVITRNDRPETKKLTIGSFTFTENEEVNEGTIFQLLSTLKSQYPEWESYQWDLLQNLFQNTESPKYVFISRKEMFDKVGMNSPAAYTPSIKTVFLNIDRLSQGSEHWKELLPWVLEERIHHITVDKIKSEEWKNSKEVKTLKTYREKLLKEWEKIEDTQDERTRKEVRYVLQPDLPVDSNEALFEFVAGVAKFNGFSKFADSIPHEETSILQAIKKAVIDFVSKILGKVSGVKKDILVEVLNIVYGEPTVEEQQERIKNPDRKPIPTIRKKPGKLTKDDFYAAEEEFMDVNFVNGIDNEICQILFEINMFPEFVTGKADLDKTIAVFRNTLVDEVEAYNNNEINLSDERLHFLSTILSSEEEFEKVIDNWKQKSYLFKTRENLIEQEDENEEEEVETATNEGQFNQWDRTVQGKSSLEQGDKYARILVKMTPKIENDNLVFHNGILQLADYTSLWNRIQDHVTDIYDFDKMVDRLYELRDVVPEFEVVVARLRQLGDDVLSQMIKSSFQRSFAKASVPTYVVDFRENKGYFREQGRLDRGKLEELFNMRFAEYVKENNLEIEVNKAGLDGSILTFPSFSVSHIRKKLNSVKNKPIQMLKVWEELGLEIPERLKGEGRDANKFKNSLITLTNSVEKMLAQLETHQLSNNWNPDQIDLPRVIKYAHYPRGQEISGLSNYWYHVIDQISKFSDITVSNMTHNAAGDNQSNVHAFSSHTTTLSIINEEISTKGDKDLAIDAAIQRGLLRLANPIFKYSLTYAFLGPNNLIQPINISGSRVYDAEFYDGTNTIDLDYIAYLRQEIFTFLTAGVKENLRAETANTSLGFKFKYASGHILPIRSALFQGDWIEYASEIFGSYLKGEVERIKAEMNSSYKYGNSKYDKKRKEFSFFSWLPEEVKQSWLKEINDSKLSPEELGASWEKPELPVLLTDYFAQSVDRFKEDVFKQTGLKLTKAHPIFNSQVQLQIREYGFDAVVNSFIVNSIISNIEHIIVSHGEIGQFDKFYKRSKSNISNGTASSFGSMYGTFEQIKDKTFTFALTGKAPDYYNRKETPLVRSIVIQEDNLEPDQQWMDEITIAVAESLANSYQEFGIEKTPEEIMEDAQTKVKAYKKTVVSDGSGFVHPDFGRAFLLSVGSWTPAMEDGYRYLMYQSKTSLTQEEERNKKRIEQEIKKKGIYWVFPIIKSQYRGNSLPVKGTPPSAEELLDKFAWTWTFPSKTNPVENALFEHMTYNNIGYGKFESGTKIATYTPDSIDDLAALKSEHIVFTDFLKEQVKTPTKAKSKTLFPTQQRKLLVSNLKSKDGYIAGLGPAVHDWKVKQREISNQQRRDLLHELGATNTDKPEIDLVKFANLVKKELERRDVPESMSSIFDLFDKVDFYRQFESALSPQMVETLLYSLLKNRIVRAMFNGSQLIQKPSTYSGNDLEFYKMVNGEVIPAECKVTLMGDFINLLELNQVKQRARQLAPKKRTEVDIKSTDKIIFGHPGIGKSFLKKNPNNFISLDDDYSDVINAFVDSKRGKLSRQEYKKKNSKEYTDMLTNIWQEAKRKASVENKVLIVSNLSILRNHPEDFDRFITMPSKTFVERSKQRKDYQEGQTEQWKEAIDKALSKVDQSKVLTTKKYLSDLFEETEVYEYEENPFERIEVRRRALNQLLLEPEFVNQHRTSLTIYSQRIPTQGFNSMDIFTIKEFLPSWDGPTIVTPPQITTKSGTDFDYDKLPSLFPEIRKDGTPKDSLPNHLIEKAKQILLSPANFHRLVTPNDTNLIVPPVEAITKEIGNPQENPVDAQVFDPTTHYKKWRAVKIKDMLGIAAVSNTFYSLMQNAESKLNPTFNISGVAMPSYSLLLTDEEKKQVDLTNPYIIGTQIEKLDYINQFINLTVDAASNDIAGYTNIIRDNTGFVLFQIEQGVPFERILKLIHHPIIYKYHQAIAIMMANGMGPRDAKKQALHDVMGLSLEKYDKYDNISNKNWTDLWTDIRQLLPPTVNERTADRKVLAFYLVGMEQASALRDIQTYLNFDTAPSRDLMQSTARERLIKDITTTDLITNIDKIKFDSVISHLDIHKDYVELSRQIFKIKRDPNFVTKAVTLGENIKSTADQETFFRVVDNDYLLSIFQNFGSVNRDWVLKQLDGELMERWSKIKEQVKGSTLYYKLVPSYSAKVRLVNPKFWMGLDQEPSEYNQIAQDLRDMILAGGQQEEFARDLIKVSLYSTGFNQSPVYTLKALPYEYVAPLLQEAYDKYEQVEKKLPYINSFLNTFLLERGGQFGKYFLKEYKAMYGISNVDSYWRQANFRQDAFRFVDYKMNVKRIAPIPNETIDIDYEEVEPELMGLPEGQRALPSTTEKTIDMQPDNIEKIKSGRKTQTIRSFKLEDGDYKMPDGTVINLTFAGIVSVDISNDKIFYLSRNESYLPLLKPESTEGNFYLINKNKFAFYEGFKDWADFKKNNKFSAKFVAGQEPRYVYEVKLVKSNTDNKMPEFDKLPFKSSTPTMTYAGIGSRKTPKEILDQMVALAKELDSRGYTLRSGGAEGADTAFEKGATKKEIFLGGKKAGVREHKIAKEIHPKWEALKSDSSRNLMARNTNQVFGEDLNIPVDFVIAWTKDGIENYQDRSINSGGTGQAIDMASRKGIPVINMFNSDWRSKLDSILNPPINESDNPFEC